MGVHLRGMIFWNHVLTGAFIKGLSFFVAGMSGFKAEFFLRFLSLSMQFLLILNPEPHACL